jgi:peptidoglycan-associated lipoprotein
LKKEANMLRKMWICLTLLVVIPGLLFTVSCAKKVVQSEPAAEEAPVEKAEPEADLTGKVAEEKAAQEEAARQLEMAAEEEMKKEQMAAEAARAAEMERANMAAKRMFMNEDIYFEFDSAVLQPMARDVLNRKAEWLRNNPDASIIIEGHCDERGTNAYNIALGDRRAESAKAYLVDLGIDEVVFATISYGEERPVDPGHNEEAWAKNRRAHFVIE